MCPLFKIPGVTVESWVVDVMHAWHLGDLLIFNAACIWFVLRCGTFAPQSASLDAEDQYRVALLRIKSELHNHYKLKRKDAQWQKLHSEV
jgi:hypothetical protein